MGAQQEMSHDKAPQADHNNKVGNKCKEHCGIWMAILEHLPYIITFPKQRQHPFNSQPQVNPHP